MTHFTPKDHYATLCVPHSATFSEIKSSYRRLALLHHPDKNGGTANSTEAFKHIQAAWEILGNEEKRLQYDAGLRKERDREAEAVRKKKEREKRTRKAAAARDKAKKAQEQRQKKEKAEHEKRRMQEEQKNKPTALQNAQLRSRHKFWILEQNKRIKDAISAAQKKVEEETTVQNEGKFSGGCCEDSSCLHTQCALMRLLQQSVSKSISRPLTFLLREKNRKSEIEMDRLRKAGLEPIPDIDSFYVDEASQPKMVGCRHRGLVLRDKTLGVACVVCGVVSSSHFEFWRCDDTDGCGLETCGDCMEYLKKFY